MTRFILIVAVLLASAANAGAQPQTAPSLPESLDLTEIRSLSIQHDGRWPPLDTVARDVVETATRNILPDDPLLLLLAWTFDPDTWEQVPLIRIANAELRAELELPADRTIFSFAELGSHPRLLELFDQLAARDPGRKVNPLEAKVGQINKKLALLKKTFDGVIIRPVPDPDNALGTWRPLASEPDAAAPGTEAAVIAWASLSSAFLSDDAAGFSAAAGELRGALDAMSAAQRPDPDLLATELRYNRLAPFTTAWKIMIAGAIFAIAALLIRRRWFDLMAVAVMLAGFGVLTYGLSMRWQIAGRIPAANMFESLLFLSWGMGAFAIVSLLLFKERLVPLTSSIMGALALFLADVLPLDGFVRPIVPVLLDTYWMSIHVPLIMLSYAVLILAALIAHIQIVLMAFAPRRQQSINTVDSLHYAYILLGAILLLCGIMTGSIWGASSWGRYWGWDPKEVWSLIAFLGYLTTLHVRLDRQRVPPWALIVAALLGIAVFAIVLPQLALLTPTQIGAFVGAAIAMIVFVALRGQFATAFKSILAFWLIMMTYVGVNFVLGIGLHSYGFGTGAIAPRMFAAGAIDLSFAIICGAIYLARRRPPAKGYNAGNERLRTGLSQAPAR